MEGNSDQESVYSHVIDTLIQTFGQVLSKDVICTVVESCGGDLNESANAIMNITNDIKTQPSINHSSNQLPSISVGNTTMRNMRQNVDDEYTRSTNNNSSSRRHKQSNTSHGSIIPFGDSVAQTPTTYAAASQITTAGPKRTQKPAIPAAKNTSFWTDEMREIFSLNNKGTRLLIIMRGAPGSGKSHLAKKVVEMTVDENFFDYKKHILSADDYFMVRGIYQFEKTKLSDAHIWNRSRARAAMEQGLSPVIIDNTNIELWEMEPYARYAVKNGYLIKVVEPNTPWAKKVNQLSRKNIHGVPVHSIKRMLDNFENGVTGEYLINYYRLSYPENMVPPVLRNIPVVPVQMPVEPSHSNRYAIPNSSRMEYNTDSTEHESITDQNIQLLRSGSSVGSEILKESNATMIDQTFTVEADQEENSLPKQYTEIEKQLEEFAKVEEEWENGETWENDSHETTNKEVDKTNVNDSEGNAEVAKPQRKTKDSVESKTTEKPLWLECQDWTKFAMFMQPWEIDINTDDNKSVIAIKKNSSSTCMEIGDTDIHNTKPLKIITATPRDINLNYMPLHNEKIPDERMFDKGSMTNEQTVTEAYRCKNEEKHFIAFRRLFKNLTKSDLRDIFDRCCGDVNWAVDIVLDGMTNKQLSVVNAEDLTDIEEEFSEQCDCVAAYNIIPDINTTPSTSSKPDEILEDTTEKTATLKKNKKGVLISESSVQLKRQIEKNVVISDNHYSDHCLKIRKIRRGEVSESEANVNEKLENPDANAQTSGNVYPSTSKNGNENTASIRNKTDDHELDVENSDDDETCLNYVEKTVNIDLGSHFVTQLDEYFGKSGLIYPDNIIPKINIPLSMLNEINALWMESVMDQLEEVTKQTEQMLQQDEEFAKQLAVKEAELTIAGKEPDVPDFKEIMDMDFAISLYQKDVAEWRNNEPSDLAAKLTRDKLYNLFPTISKDLLSELLMAHDNNFQATVEVLLMSTGQSAVLEAQNGVNKFVMNKEIQRQEKILQEHKKALSEVEWPLLPKEEKIDMDVVTHYREEAETHLAQRNLSYQKARGYIQRGMTQVASYYSEIAAFHKRSYEHANSLAAASLLQVHAANNPDNSTIDLHFLRVGEAKEGLDLFLDFHIQKLRELQHKSNFKYQTLFFITGRGLHSNGGPKVKPAIKKRLQERGLAFSERNPGLLTAKVCAEDKLFHEIA